MSLTSKQVDQYFVDMGKIIDDLFDYMTESEAAWASSVSHHAVEQIHSYLHNNILELRAIRREMQKEMFHNEAQEELPV